ncbi:hypothetical protein [Streptomyces sp. NPDC096152]|uniref:hypothetical protein n=1 Tax=Streptomyces sp. NPDC096152 TaxID=3366078 RepID=UPI00382AED0B
MRTFALGTISAALAAGIACAAAESASAAPSKDCYTFTWIDTNGQLQQGQYCNYNPYPLY